MLPKVCYYVMLCHITLSTILNSVRTVDKSAGVSTKIIWANYIYNSRRYEVGRAPQMIIYVKAHTLFVSGWTKTLNMKIAIH